MKELVKAMQNVSYDRLKRNNGTVYIIGNNRIQKHKTIVINGLRIEFGGKYELIKDDEDLVLKINLKVKNIDDDINFLDSYTIQSYDAKGVELNMFYGGIHFNDPSAVDEDVKLLPEATLSQNYYLKYPTPYIVALLILNSNDDDNKEYIPLMFVEKNSMRDFAIKKDSIKNENEREAFIREYLTRRVGAPKTEEEIQYFEKTIQELKNQRI